MGNRFAAAHPILDMQMPSAPMNITLGFIQQQEILHSDSSRRPLPNQHNVYNELQFWHHHVGAKIQSDFKSRTWPVGYKFVQPFGKLLGDFLLHFSPWQANSRYTKFQSWWKMSTYVLQNICSIMCRALLAGKAKNRKEPKMLLNSGMNKSMRGPHTTGCYAEVKNESTAMPCNTHQSCSVKEAVQNKKYDVTPFIQSSKTSKSMVLEFRKALIFGIKRGNYWVGPEKCFQDARNVWFFDVDGGYMSAPTLRLFISCTNMVSVLFAWYVIHEQEVNINFLMFLDWAVTCEHPRYGLKGWFWKQ